MSEDRTTPRPWKAVGGPQNGVDYIVGPSKDDFLTGPLRRDNAALIVTAVNQYDRLRAIEKAARELIDYHDGGGFRASHPDDLFTALRDALEGADAAPTADQTDTPRTT